MRNIFKFPPPKFDGITYQPKHDRARLTGQLGRVYEVLVDGKWHTIPEITEIVGGTPQAISARLRDFRKERFGGYTVERKRIGGGLFKYRLADGP